MAYRIFSKTVCTIYVSIVYVYVLYYIKEFYHNTYKFDMNYNDTTNYKL